MRWLVLAAFLAACFAVAAIGGWLTSLGMPEWYMTLRKPTWNPPSWLFGPVWTTLYVAMAVAAWLVWKQAGFDGATAALSLFFVQLALNLAWSGIFFALRSPGWALVEIVALWVAIVVTTILFFRHSAWAGALMVPYLLWVSFASVLNAAIVRLN
ncbi:MAG: TspO/MBR family protein [Candidatus Longimicrobiales bacterium M2_2A_002]